MIMQFNGFSLFEVARKTTGFSLWQTFELSARNARKAEAEDRSMDVNAHEGCLEEEVH